MRTLILLFAVLLFSGCGESCYVGTGKVYKTGEYYQDCGCPKSGLLQFFQNNKCKCSGYRYMGPTTSCGADGMCVNDEF